MADIPSFEDTEPVSAAAPTTAEAPLAAPQAPVPQAAAPEAAAPPSFEQTEPVQAVGPSFEDTEALGDEKYETTKQQLLGGAEAVSRGLISSPVTNAIEKHIFGVKDEDIIGREEAHKVRNAALETAALVGGSFIPVVGELTLAGQLARAGEAAATASKLGKIGSGAIRGLVEGGLLQGSDEVGRAMLGQGDPEAPVSSALMHMGAAGLIGGGFGGAFGAASAGLNKLGESKAGSKFKQLLTDFGNAKNLEDTHGSVEAAVANEVGDALAANKSLTTGIYGDNSAGKLANIQQLTPEMASEKIQQHLSTVSEALTDPGEDLLRNGKFKDAFEAYRAATTAVPEVGAEGVIMKQPSTGEIFMATDRLKQTVQKLAKYSKLEAMGAEATAVQEQARKLAPHLASSLEDTAVWGDAAKYQKELNNIISDYLPAHEDLSKMVTEKVEGVRTPSITKAKTYLSKSGLPEKLATTQQKKMANFVKATEQLHSGMDALHAKYDLPNATFPVSMSTLKGTLGQPTLGAQLYQHTKQSVIPTAMEKVAGPILGAEFGAKIGGLHGAAAGMALGALLPIVKKTLGHEVNARVLPTILKALSSEQAEHIYQAIDHANIVNSGAQKINSGIANIFKKGSSKAVNAATSNRSREKLRKMIEDGTVLEGTTQPAPSGPPPQTSAPAAFAHGGSVHKMPEGPKMQPKERPVTNSRADAIAAVYPEQGMLMSAARTRVGGYLNSIRPMPSTTKLAFDKDHKNIAKEKSYNQALDLANDPLTILNHIKDGSVTSDMMKHFVSMYPEAQRHLSNKLTEHITKAQLKKELPEYRTRKGIALFMGQPMDSTMLPANIMAAQPLPPAPPPENKTGSPKKTLKGVDKMPKQYQTPSQSAEEDMSKH